MWQSYVAHPRCKLVVRGGYGDILKVWSPDKSREDFEGLASNHEEAWDTRIILHATDATVRGCSQVNNLCHYTSLLCQNIWMFPGNSRRKRCIPVHKIALPENITASISCITGCRTTSKFVDIGKQKAWKAVDGRSVERLSTLLKKAILMLKYLQMLAL